MPDSPAGRQWLTLSEALAVAGVSEAQVCAALLAGDVRIRALNGDGTTTAVQPSQLVRAKVDWSNSRIEAKAPPWFAGPVEVSRQDLIDYFGIGAKAPRGNVGGRSRSWEWERALVGVFGQIYRNEKREPERLADAERLLAEWFAAQYDKEPKSESQIRTHAKLLYEEIEKGR